MDTIERYRALRSAGHDSDIALGVLYREGAGFLDCIRALHDVDGLPLGDAKVAVHKSPAWENSRADREAFWDQVIALLKEETVE